MKIVADLHTHSVASDHAYSTIGENCKVASERGLYAIAATDHGPNIQDGAHAYHFRGMKDVLPRRMNGVYVIRGIESNLLNENGDVDIASKWQDVIEFGIASIHDECFGKSDVKRTTRAYLNVLDHPAIDILGHSGTAWYPFDYEEVVKKCARLGKLIEINAASFRYRFTSLPNCKELAKLCMKHGVGIMVNSDAHVAQAIGDVSAAIKMLEDLEFPEELLINGSIRNLANYFMNQKKLDILE